MARNNADLLRLLEFCALTDTLVLDTDGIYDLQDFNDRLLLGLKAQMSEAELHVMAGRLQGAKRAAAERGELRFGLPVGYVYDEDGLTIIDPDEEVQAAIADVFAAFVETGSAYGVLGAFKGRRFPKRAWGGAWAGELRWGVLSHPRVVRMLQNPCYAGAYVFGRCRSRRVVRPDGTITTATVELPRSEWPVLIRDHHPGYITWDAYLANEQRLAKNHTRQGQRPPREGTALCQGIVRCGACGHSMSVQYRAKGAHYDCSASRINHIQTPGCRSVKAAGVDELVARRLLAALAPEEIALALAAADEVSERRARSDRALELRVERARYDAARAERAFHACEPENRLVARSLETRWEAKAPRARRGRGRTRRADHARTGALARAARGARARRASAVGRGQHIREGPQTAAARPDRRRHDHQPARGSRRCSRDPLALRRRRAAHDPATTEHQRHNPHPARDDRADHTPGPAAHQHRDRRPTQRRRAADRQGPPVQRPRRASHPPSPQHPHNPPPHDDRLTVNQVAERLGVSPGVIYDWISHNKLAAHRDRANRLRIPFDPAIEQECRRAGRELQPHPRNQNRRYRRCSLMPAFPSRRSEPRRASSRSGCSRRARRES